MRQALERLIGSLELRRELGVSARQLALDRFSLHRAARVQEGEYLAAVQERVAPGPLGVDLIRSAAGVLGAKLRRKYQRWRGTAAVDDSKTRPPVATMRAGGRTKGGQKEQELSAVDAVPAQPESSLPR